ncbi:MAG: GTPase Era, partial [Bacilli bacterium]|nr:GTPase Era [Bacilli bacterium]
MRSGFVSLIGRPNVGKSTLLNSIVGKKVAITSNKPQTTRNIIQGIYNDDDSQIVFVDTPGIHKPNHKLGTYLNKQAYYSIDDVDIILVLVDVSMKLGGGDKFVIDRIKDVNKPVILILNKIDKIKKE